MNKATTTAVVLAVFALLGWTGSTVAAWAPILAMLLAAVATLALEVAHRYVEKTGPENTHVDEVLAIIEALDDDALQTLAETALGQLTERGLGKLDREDNEKA